jgi:methylenetetrahydrofolate reductase (NADPH)
MVTLLGYPEKHVESKSYEEDLKLLKEKVDAGADLIITQLFYDTKLFLKFVKDCRDLGIKCPIIPGMMPIHGFAGFERMTTLCKTSVPDSIREALEPIKTDDEAVKAYGIKLCIEMCKELLANGVEILHFYTLNLEKSVTAILEGLGLLDPEVRRPLPWRSRPSLTNSRGKETVRPIFWANRPKSYMQRTQSWDEFPNGRWGDSGSPAFGDLDNYHLMTLHMNKSELQQRAKMWGTDLTSEDQVKAIFVKYVNGEIPSLPWCDQQLSPESNLIRNQLIKINKMGFLTINSQPAVNGLPSSDEVVGWGPKGGFVYQKAYVEFFLQPSMLPTFLEAVKKFPSLTYHAVNLKGEQLTNTSKQHANALTWGVFPGKEIVQPTVVDTDSFIAWKVFIYHPFPLFIILG